MSNNYSPRLLSINELSISSIGTILFNKGKDFTSFRYPEIPLDEKHFEACMAELIHSSDVISTYICFLAAMSQKDLKEYKDTFL